jgi:hypothetical protein
MKIKMITLALILWGCGSNGNNGNNGGSCNIVEEKDQTIIVCPDGSKTVVDDGESGTSGKDGTSGTDGKDGNNYIAPVNIFGFWSMPNGGYVEIIQTSDERALLYGTVRIYSVNFDGSLALYPAFAAGPYYIRDSKVLSEFNGVYGVTNGLAVDGGAVSISGTRKTVFTIERSNVIVYSLSGLVIESNRTIVSQ